MHVHGLIALLLATVAHGKLSPLYRSADPVQGHYLVRIQDTGEDSMNNFRLELTAQNDRNELSGSGFGHIRILDEIDGTDFKLFSVELDYKSLDAIRKHPSVQYVEEETKMKTVAERPEDIDGDSEDERSVGIGVDKGYFGLDRINQANLPLDGNMTFDGDGFGVNIYIVDAGIQVLHRELECRAREAYDVLGRPGKECKGADATGVASVAAGKSVGVAGGANIRSVRVMDCETDLTEVNYIKGMEWIVKNGMTPCVVLLSRTLPGSQSVDDATEKLSQPIDGAEKEGCVIVTSAGWEPSNGGNACDLSPGRTHNVINVAETNANDLKTHSSFYGVCIDIFAPGNAVTTAIRQDSETDDEYALSYGTSISAAFVAGVAAIHLGNKVPASEVKERILTDATPCVVVNEGRGSPDRLLYVDPGK